MTTKSRNDGKDGNRTANHSDNLMERRIGHPLDSRQTGQRNQENWGRCAVNRAAN
jgi:hypothetical protein